MQISNFIDHTKLTFAADEDPTAAIQKLCEEAKTYGFFAVCVRPYHVALAKACLKTSPVKVATVIGFPEQKLDLMREREHPSVGSAPLTQKCLEIDQLRAGGLEHGADELDVVIDVANFQNLSSDLRAMKTAAQGLPIKVILETDLLTDAQITEAIIACADVGVAMVKTSTGILVGGRGADLKTVGLMSDVIRRNHFELGIKASGGIKTRAQAEALLALGVARLGTSAGVDLLTKINLSAY